MCLTSYIVYTCILLLLFCHVYVLFVIIIVCDHGVLCDLCVCYIRKVMVCGSSEAIDIAVIGQDDATKV